MSGKRGLLAGLLLLGAALAGGGMPQQPAMLGDTQIHDPTVLKVGGHYVAMGTGLENVDGGALRLKTSPDGLHWKDAGTLGDSIPDWIYDKLGTQPPNLWAPTLSQRRGVTYLYYAASTFGTSSSVIGLMTNAHLDLAHPGKGWIDRGMVLQTSEGSTFNAIDPYRLDTTDGRAWLVYGSYWTGIKLRELDPAGGLLLRNAKQYDLASRGGGAIEAATLMQHGGYYYLFVSFDRCCAGIDSTYRIMVGRASKVTGPYTARDGTPMMQGGATQVQASQGRFIGPGGQEVVHGATDLLVYHYYDAHKGGQSHIQLSKLLWDAQGWPLLGAPPQQDSGQ